MSKTPQYERTPDPVTAEVAKARREVTAISSPVLTTVADLSVVDSTTYAEADGILSRIRAARKQVAEKFDPIIQKIRPGLDLIYKFRKELDDPLTSAETQVKLKMSIWQATERKRIQTENEAVEREKEKLRRELEAKTLKAEAATRPSVKTALMNSSTALAQKLADAEAQPEATATKGQHSSTRTIKIIEVTDRKLFLKAVLEGEVPMEAILINDTKMREWLKSDSKTVASWPGVRVFEDVQIVGR